MVGPPIFAAMSKVADKPEILYTIKEYIVVKSKVLGYCPPSMPFLFFI